ncbi:MAG: WD40/YVTN/BNR-like repeat-containing protein, partial [Armatimonadota bacterium]
MKLEAESFFGGVLWRKVGPEQQSGRVLTIHSPEKNPNDVYVAFATGGLYRTSDDGQSWTSLFDNQSAFSIGDFDITADGKTIYLGTGEANNQRTSYSGTGMFKSTDSGKTWTNIGLPESHHIAKVTIDPKNENIVWVAVI